MCRRAGRFHGKLICGHAGHARARRGLKCAPARRTRQLWAIAEGAGGKSCWHGQHELMQQYERTVGVRTTGPLNARAAGPCSGQIVGSVAEQRRSRGAKARRRDRGGLSPRRRGQQGEKFLLLRPRFLFTRSRARSAWVPIEYPIILSSLWFSAGTVLI